MDRTQGTADRPPTPKRVTRPTNRWQWCRCRKCGRFQERYTSANYCVVPGCFGQIERLDFTGFIQGDGI